MPTLTTLVSFNPIDEALSLGGLLADAAGDLFGTTVGEGLTPGTVFEIPLVSGSYASTPTTLSSFNLNGLSGSVPIGDLIADAAGDLFGTTSGGGTYSAGTVFELVNNGGGSYSQITLLNFKLNGTNGQYPNAGLIADSAGDLFGVTDSNVFELVNNGGGNYTPTTLASLDTSTAAGPGTLIMDAAGDLFDTTDNGGADGQGSVFELVNNGGGNYTQTTLASVNDATDGLLMDTAGNLFGTTSSTVFELVNNGGGSYTLTMLVNFNGADGSDPVGPLIVDAAGNLYGTTFSGGTSDQGTVFEIPLVNGTYASAPTTLVSFNGTDGFNPVGGLIANAAGDLFGTTNQGGLYGAGMVFELTDTGFQPPVPPNLEGGFGTVFYTPKGAPVAIDDNIDVSDATSSTLAGATVAIGAGFLAGDTLNFMNQNGITGSYDAATGVLTLTGTASLADYDDAFTGITFSSTSGNPSNSGADPSRTVSWTVTDGTLSSNTVTTTVDITTIPTPTLITLVSFDGTDGSDPEAGVIADAAGDLLGTTFLGGANFVGTVFDIFKTNGTYASTPTTLLNFSSSSNFFGSLPTSGLIANAGASFLGTTSAGGANGFGTVYAFSVNTQDGLSISETELVSFNKATINSTEGETPNGGLLIDANENLFGTTSGGGANNDGTVFELPSMFGDYSSTPTTLVSFDGTDGSNPQSTLIKDAAGDFFGTTYAGGANGGGTVFEIPHTSGLLTLYSFANTFQPAATAGLIMDAAGDLFDTTYAGGSDSDGSVFEIAKTNSGYASTPTTLVSFDGTDGATPEAGLIIDAAGNLFGTTSGGGTYGEGTVFEIPLVNGSYASAPTTLVNFNVENGDGAFPAATLTADAAGDLFGTTEQGGANDGNGTVFEVTGSGFQVPSGPVLSGGGNTVTYTPGGTAITVDAGLGVSDTSSATLAGGTVTIGAGFLAGDTLNYTSQNGITGSYNGNTGILTLTGTSSIANYQAALDSIAYGFNPANGDPTGGGNDEGRTIDWVVNDGQSNSNQATSIVSILAVTQPPTVAANNQSVAYNISVGLGSIFTLGGGPATSFNVYLDGPNDGTVTGGSTPVTPGKTINESAASFAGMSFIGAGVPGSDGLWLQAVNSAGSSAWVEAMLTEPGVMPDVVTAHNQSAAFTQQVALSTLFTVAGSAPTEYDVYLTGPSDGTVTGGNNAVVANTTVEEDNLAGMNFVGGLANGSDQVYLRAFDGQWSNWALATVTDTGAITANPQSVAYNQSVPLSSIFTVTGVGSITSYNVYLGPNDGTVTGGSTPVIPGVTVNESAASFAGMDFVGGGAPGGDELWLQAVTAQGTGTWTLAMLTEPGVAPDVVTAHNQSAAFTQQVALSTLFTVAGSAPTEYDVYLTGPSDGTVTGGNNAVVANTTVEEDNLAGMNFVGGLANGSDQVYLRAFDGQWSNWALATVTDTGAITANPQSVAYNQSVPLSSIFTVTGGGSITSYNVYLGPNDGTVTGGSTPVIPGVTVNESAASFAGMDFVGGGAPGGDELWLQAVTAQGTGTWTLATLTEPGVAPDVVTGLSISPDLAFTEQGGLSGLFTVTGNAPTQYDVYLTGPNDGTVTGGNNPVVANTITEEDSLTGMNFGGGIANGSDQVWVRAFDGQWSNWAPATWTDTGAVTGNNQFIAHNQSVPLSSIFTVTGGGSITSYNVYLDGPTDATVTGGSTPVTPGTTVNETAASFAGMNYVGGYTSANDVLWLQAVDGQQTGTWVKANLDDTGPAYETIAYGQSLTLSSIFMVPGGASITSYNVDLISPNDGTVTGGSAPVTPGKTINETAASFAGMNYIGGNTTGSDGLWLQAVTAQGAGPWVFAVITDQSGANDTVSAGHATNVIYMGGPNQTLLETTEVFTDTVIGFDQGAGDRIHLLMGGDTVAEVLAHSTQVNGGADTLITWPDNATILLKGVTTIDASFFA